MFKRMFLRRNDYCQASRPNLENEARKGPGSPNRFCQSSKLKPGRAQACQNRFCRIFKRRFEKKWQLPGTPTKPRKWSLGPGSPKYVLSSFWEKVSEEMAIARHACQDTLAQDPQDPHPRLQPNCKNLVLKAAFWSLGAFPKVPRPNANPDICRYIIT